MLLTKGDANDAVDLPVAADGVLGRVTHYFDGTLWIAVTSGWRSWSVCFAIVSPFSPPLVRISRLIDRVLGRIGRIF